MTDADLRAEIEDLRRRLAEAEAELEDRKQFVAQVMEAEDRARLRIAELIHDDALQSLLAANQDLIEAAPGREQVTRAHEVVSGTIEQLREAMVALHPVTLQQGGLEQALSAVARQAERQSTGLAVTVELDPAAVGRNDELIVAISRELLSNVARHSHARNASVGVRAHDGAVEVTVADDGAGMDPERRREALAEGHIGLASVTQRVEANGGELQLQTTPESGTQVWARLLDQVPGARS
jgi:two-component system NarL family sensor kinase